MAPARLSTSTDVFKALGHPGRLRILGMLREGGLCVCQLTAVLESAVSTVSAHLGELKRAGLVAERRDGRWVVYSLAEGMESLLSEVWGLIDRDPQVKADGRLVRGLRRVPLERLCRADLDLERVGLRRRSGRRSETWKLP